MESKDLDIQLRDATAADESFLLAVYASTRGHELEGLGWDEQQKQSFLRMQFFARERSYPQLGNRIILVNGSPAGRLLIDRSGATISLIDIALLTEYRNAGIGSRLLQDLLNEAISGGKPVRLHVLSSSPAFRLYKRLGFNTTGDEGAYLEMTWDPSIPIVTES